MKSTSIKTNNLYTDAQDQHGTGRTMTDRQPGCKCIITVYEVSTPTWAAAAAADDDDDDDDDDVLCTVACPAHQQNTTTFNELPSHCRTTQTHDQTSDRDFRQYTDTHRETYRQTNRQRDRELLQMTVSR